MRFKDKKSVQLLALFEAEEMGAKIAMNESNGSIRDGSIQERSTQDGLRVASSTLLSSPFTSPAYAASDYTDRYPAAFGKKL